MLKGRLVEVELCKHLVVALKNLYGVPSLLLLGESVDGGLFNVRESVLDGALKGVHREGLCVLRRLDCRLGRSHDSVAF